MLGFNLYMRKPAKWMVSTDERILEYMIEYENPTSAGEINKSGKVLAARSTISKRLSKMADAGLVDRLPNGVFSITEKGKGYLEGEYNVESGEWVDGE
jgi:Mn-dependent DtxR family transcriptional regulator